MSMKNPTIHISREGLRAILDAYGILFAEDLTNFIVKESHAVSLENLSLITVNKASATRCAKVKEQLEEQEDAPLFNQCLTVERTVRKHVFCPIDSKDRQWATLVMLTKIGNQMALDFGITKVEAYSAYIRISLDLMKKGYALNKMQGYRDRVYEILGDERELLSDANPEGTQALMDAYSEEATHHFGREYHVLYTDRIHFYKARQIADTVGADYASFVMAQIQGMEYLNVFPEPFQLHSDQAEHRYLHKRKVQKEYVQALASSEYMGD